MGLLFWDWPLYWDQIEALLELLNIGQIIKINQIVHYPKL